jgi:conjugal transfer/entry exclusion protein
MVVLGWSTPAQAQLAVIDAANLVQNVVTAVQTVFMVANQILELTGLDEIVLGDDFQSDLEALGTIVQEARGLSYDMSSLQAQVTILFSLDSAPNSAHELRERLAAIRRVVFDSYLYALRTQTLLKTTLSTVRHLTRLVSAIGAFVGNMQGNQTMAQMESTLSETLARLQVHTAAYERAQSVERLTEPLTMESLHRINDAIMVDHPQ